jgi:hypothetical protein
MLLSSLLMAQGTVVNRSPDYWYANAAKLPIGATVRVRTSDGKRRTAVLSRVEPDGITVEFKSRVPEPARRFSYDQIQQLELKSNGGTNLAKAAAVGAAIGAGTFVGLLALLASSWD